MVDRPGSAGGVGRILVIGGRLVLGILLASFIVIGLVGLGGI